MWYKFDESANEWFEGNKVNFPDGTILDENHETTKEGWFWSDEEPIECTEYKQNRFLNLN